MFGLDLGIKPVLGDRRMLHPGKRLWARTLCWIVILVFAIMLPFGLVLETLLRVLPNEAPFQFLAHLAGALIVLAAYYVLVQLGEGRVPTELAVASAPLGILAGLAIGLTLFAFVMAILMGVGAYTFAYQGFSPAWRGAALAIESGVLEEVLVRGVVLRLLWRAFGPWLAFIASAFLFGAGHIANPNATLFTVACVAIEAGIMLGAFYALTGRLWVSIGVHAGWNFTQGYLFGAAVSGGNFGDAIAKSAAHSDYPSWLSGGAFGPEASLPALLVCGAVGGLVLWLAWREGRFTKDVATLCLRSQIAAPT